MSSQPPALGIAAPRDFSRARPRRGKGRRYVLLTVVALLAPAVLLRGFTALWPFVATARDSFFHVSPLDPSQNWAGFGNYLQLLASEAAQAAMSYTLLFTIASTALELVAGVAIAQLLNSQFRLRRVIQSLNLIPWAVPTVVTAIGFRFALDPSSGLFSYWFSQVTGLHVEWLISPWPARIAVVLTNVWRNAPFVAMVVLAAQQAIPAEVYDAALVDGATSWRTFRSITLPLILPVLISVGIFFLIWQVTIFDLILAMTGGGPGDATQVLGYLAYLTGFQGLDFGKSAALSMMLFAFVALMGLFGWAAMRQVERRL